MNIRIGTLRSFSNVDNAIQLGKFWATKVISITDPINKYSFNVAWEVPFLIAFISDLGVMNNESEKEEVNNILKFAETFNEDDNVLIHCVSGISRASAVVLGILLQQGYSVDDAIVKLFEIQPFAKPNVNIVCHLENIFNNDSILLKLDIWQNG